jgi:RNA polymerase sigma-70 factor (ECF subfamily)
MAFVSLVCFTPALPKAPCALLQDLRKVLLLAFRRIPRFFTPTFGRIPHSNFLLLSQSYDKLRYSPSRTGTRLEPQTDEELVASLRLGDIEAFEELYHRYKRQIFTFCLQLTCDRFLAEDATHDAFMKMYQNIGSLSDASLFHSWLYAIARNRVYDLLKRGRSNGKLDDESIWSEETPLDLTEANDTSAVLSACIDALKPEYKEVLLLREYEQRTYAEIAAITGDTESSVKSRLFKARRALAEKLKPYFKA